MMNSRASPYVTTALAGGVLAGFLAPSAAFAACLAPNSLDNGPQFQGLISGTVNAVSSVVTTITTTDSALVAQGTSAFVVGTPTETPNQLGGGVWARGVGGNFLTSVPTNGTISDTLRGTQTVESTPVNCQTRTRQGFGGAQVGADVANLNFGASGGTLHVGLTSGFVETSAVTDSTNVAFQVPFFGLYSALTYGNFFADAQIRGNFFEGSITDSLNNIPGEKLNARGFTVSGNIGYRYNLPADWFIEPSVGINWSRTFVDPVSFQGTQIFLPPGFSPGLLTSAGPSTLNINDFDNILGRASLRVGTTLVNGQYIFQPFFTASVYHEFADPIQSTVFGVHNLDADFLTTVLSTGRIGTYGQFGLGVTGQIADTGLTGFVRGDYRTGSHFEGWSLTGGARYDFNPESGHVIQGRSADIAGAPLAPTPYNWSGFFVGVSEPGALWGETKWSFTNGFGSTANNYSGLLAGGGGGYNYQMGALVIGGQAEWDWTNARGGESFSGGTSFSCPLNTVVLNVPPFTALRSLSVSCATRVNSIFTATARLGYALDRLLVYGQGGLAVGNVAASSVSNSFSPGGTLASDSKTAVGWTLGAGFEFGLTQNISAKAEYLYFDLGSDTYNLGVPVSINRTGNIGRVGLNYRFN
jgi:opacity protein-like surface antigen